jgi:hypothetical protein
MEPFISAMHARLHFHIAKITWMCVCEKQIGTRWRSDSTLVLSGHRLIFASHFCRPSIRLANYNNHCSWRKIDFGHAEKPIYMRMQQLSERWQQAKYAKTCAVVLFGELAQQVVSKVGLWPQQHAKLQMRSIWIWCEIVLQWSELRVRFFQ